MNRKRIKKDEILVSVIIPAYNAEKYIKQAIDSVLIQDVPVEIIVINDCSIDNTEKIIYEYIHLDFFKYIKNDSNIGVAESRNKGIRISQGKYIAFLDADDWWEKDKLLYQVDILEKDKYRFCYTGRVIWKDISDDKKNMISVEQIIDFKKLIKHNCVSCSSVMLPASIAKKYLMICDDAHEDFLMWLRILKDGGQAYGINLPLLNYRIVHGSKSNNKLISTRMTYKTYYYITNNKLISIKYTIMHLIKSIIIRIKK